MIWFGHKKPGRSAKPEFELVYNHNEWSVSPADDTRKNRKSARALEARVKGLDGGSEGKRA